ncbi:MAG: N-acetyltransferase [Prevotella sp.]|nr:N-acetyltransferase [Prevotella sp.]
MEIKQTEQGQGGLFEAYEGEERMGYMSYEWEDDSRFAITHTVVEPSHQGKGIAAALLDSAADYARENGKKIHAVCSFVVAKFRRSAAYDDVKAF